jgi:hypothetical protein
MDIVVLAAAIIAAARAAATLARKYSAYDVTDQIYKLLTQYGDAVHIALGIFTARLFDYAKAMPQAAAAAAIIAMLYVAYQIMEDLEAPPQLRSAPKDIAVYMASLAATLAALWSIPLQISI